MGSADDHLGQVADVSSSLVSQTGGHPLPMRRMPVVTGLDLPNPPGRRALPMLRLLAAGLLGTAVLLLVSARTSWSEPADESVADSVQGCRRPLSG